MSTLIGAHPHAVQPLEREQGAAIAYSLGNFVFDQKEPPTRRGAVGVFTLCGGALAHAHLAPVAISIRGTPRFMP